MGFIWWTVPIDWLLLLGLCHHCLSIVFRQESILDRRTCVYISLLIAWRETSWTKDIRMFRWRFHEGARLTSSCSMISVCVLSPVMGPCYPFGESNVVYCQQHWLFGDSCGPSIQQLIWMTPSLCKRNFICWQEMASWNLISPNIWRYHYINIKDRLYIL